MDPKVVFYRLTTKFVNQSEDIPENARQVIYYTLCVGHHVGVMDCFQPLVEVSLEEYKRWVGALPAGAARSKLEGVLTWSEIEINANHAGNMLTTLKQQMDGFSWVSKIIESLEGMLREPAFYLMVRKYS